MNFLTKVVHKDTIVGTRFDTKKVQNAVKKRGRAVIFWCRVSGAYYLNTKRIYDLPACETWFDDASTMPGIKVNIEVKGKAYSTRDGNYPI